uniref:Transcription elongation factor B polypeptide 3 n=1 Tax=Hydra vulgaris TaxID=6087 RepID=T2MCW9_HYDVU
MNHDELVSLIFRIQKKLQKTDYNPSKKLKILKKLGEIPVDVNVLRETGIGKTVNSLRKCEGPIGEQAKALVIQWRDNVNSLLTKEDKGKKETKSDLSSTDTEKNLKNEKINNFLNGKTEPLKQKEDISHIYLSPNKSKRSFEEMLIVPEIVHRQKKKKNFHSKVTESVVDTKSNRFSMPKLPDIELPEYMLSVPKTEYRPLPEPVSSKKKTEHHVDDQNVIIKRGSRGQMYSGKKQANGVVMTLYQLCMKVLMENINSLYETGGVPFIILEPLLAKCSPSELQRLEEYNPHFLDESERLWKIHSQREFKGKVPESNESWRDLFHRLNIEREERLQKLSTKITISQAAKAPERSVKLAYLAGTPKGSAQVMRKQKKFGTGLDSIGQSKLDLKERIEKQREKEADVAVPFVKVRRKEKCTINHNSVASTNSQSENVAVGPSRLKHVKKKGKSPLMAAAMKLLSNQKNRVHSQVIRK